MHEPYSKTRRSGAVVPALSKVKIAAQAAAVRSFWSIENLTFFPIVKIYSGLEMMVDGASFEVFEEEEMGEDHGLTYPDRKLIQLRNDVYEGACRGLPRDRFTLCHELGHLLMHKNMAMARVDPDQPPPIYRNSEWQADMFASYLLMPANLLRRFRNIADVTSEFGVSTEAALARRAELK